MIKYNRHYVVWSAVRNVNIGSVGRSEKDTILNHFVIMALSYSQVTGNGGQDSLADLFARYKYKETIGLLYLHNEKAEISDVLELLRKLNVDRIHVEGIQRDSEKWYSRLLIKFKPQFVNVFERVKKLDGNVLSVRGGEARVIIQDMTGDMKYVSVYLFLNIFL